MVQKQFIHMVDSLYYNSLQIQIHLYNFSRFDVRNRNTHTHIRLEWRERERAIESDRNGRTDNTK